MKLSVPKVFLFLLIGLSGVQALLGQTGTAVPNWTVPPYRAQSASGGLTTMADVSEAAIFVAVDPCRLADTRQVGFPAG